MIAQLRADKKEMRSTIIADARAEYKKARDDTNKKYNEKLNSLKEKYPAKTSKKKG